MGFYLFIVFVDLKSHTRCLPVTPRIQQIGKFEKMCYLLSTFSELCRILKYLCIQNTFWNYFLWIEIFFPIPVVEFLVNKLAINQHCWHCADWQICSNIKADQAKLVNHQLLHQKIPIYWLKKKPVSEFQEKLLIMHTSAIFTFLIQNRYILTCVFIQAIVHVNHQECESVQVFFFACHKLFVLYPLLF